MANPEHIEWLLEGVEAWNSRREQKEFRPDFEGVDNADLRKADLTNADLVGAILTGAKLNDANLVNADLREANLCEANLRGANLTDAKLHDAKLRNAILNNAILINAKFTDANLRKAKLYNANLTDAILTGAKLHDADLRNAILNNATLLNAKLIKAHLFNADLSNANLDIADLTKADLLKATLHKANLTNADLTGTDLSYSEPWKADLYTCPSNVETGQETPKKKIKTFLKIPGVCLIRRFFARSWGSPRTSKWPLKSIDSLLEECRCLQNKHSGDFLLYFRGEGSNYSSGVRPSVMRPSTEDNFPLRESEDKMLFDLISRQPEEFSDLISAIEQWVLAQHHGLKTRLLDITRNPLVALFNVCKKCDKQNDGCLHVFAIPSSLVKPFNSDTISIIANFSKLRRHEQDLLLGKKEAPYQGNDGYAKAMGRLYHFIRHEKPYFLEKIDPRDLFGVFVVEPKRSFERIRAQSGAFLISAFHERFERDEILKWNARIPVYYHYTLTVAGKYKKDIMKELSLLNITNESLFPGLDEAANAVTQHYSEKMISERVDNLRH